MSNFSTNWAELLERPYFALTADQDWAPEWAVDIFLEELRSFRVPLHVFRTNPSSALDRLSQAGDLQQGWHPNFQAGSSHGSTAAEVVRYCQCHFPGATTVRSHGFAEDTFSWRELRASGIVADSQLCSLFQGYLLPVAHWTGIVRLPVYFEDDILFDLRPSLDLEAILSTLFTPGLKVLNFHPTFVGCNTPSRAYHESLKSRIFTADSAPDKLRWPGRGTTAVFRELVDRILSQGHRFYWFQDLVEMALLGLSAGTEIVAPLFKPLLGTAARHAENEARQFPFSF